MSIQRSQRKDWHFGPIHVIRRGYRDNPQYGCLLWGVSNRTPTFDVWFKQTLWTVRLDK